MDEKARMLPRMQSRWHLSFPAGTVLSTSKDEALTVKSADYSTQSQAC